MDRNSFLNKNKKSMCGKAYPSLITLNWSAASLATSYPVQLILTGNDEKRTCIDFQRNLDILGQLWRGDLKQNNEQSKSKFSNVKASLLTVF